MSVLTALALIEAASAPLAPNTTGRTAVAVFRDACVEGRVRLSKTEVRPIKRNNVPAVVLAHLRAWPWHITPETQYFELMPPEGKAFLVIQPGTARSRDGRYCSVASKHINYWDARVGVEQFPNTLKVIDPAVRRQMEEMGYSHTTSTFGYETELRRAGRFILMTTFLPARKTAH